MDKVKGDNEDFQVARNAFLNFFNGTLAEGNREQLLVEFELEYLRAILEHFEDRLDAFRSVASRAAQAIQEIEEEAEYARQTGRFPEGEGRSNAYILDVEALMEVGGERLWNYFFEDRFVSGGRELNYFDQESIFSVITAAFNPKSGEGSGQQTKQADEIIAEIEEGLQKLARQQLSDDIVGSREGGTDMSQKGLLMGDALEYEARYHFRKQFAQDNLQKDPSRDQIEDYLKNKIRFCAKKADPLATFIQSDHPGVVNAESTYIGMHEAYDDHLGGLVDQVVPHANKLPNWFDEKSLVFYTANLNVPLFYYKRVNDEMKHHYRQVTGQGADDRGYPLHIDANWEESLPDLDPTEHKQADRQQARKQQLLNYCIGLACGTFQEDSDSGEVYWQAEQYSEKLGDDLVDGFESLDGLDDRTRRKLFKTIRKSREGIASGTDMEAVDALDRFQDALDDRIWRAERQSNPESSRLLEFLTDQEAALQIWRDELD